MREKIFRPKKNYVIIFVTTFSLLLAVVGWNNLGSATPNPPGWEFKIIFFSTSWLFTMALIYFGGTIRVSSDSIFCIVPFVFSWRRISVIEIDTKKKIVNFKKNKGIDGGFKYKIYENPDNILEMLEKCALLNNVVVNYI